ncbi:hypothetical protein H072_6277 [Dactylellina haptotyla CBS 200.50]|uniref:CBM1 domain-containing protein n=1 Tax=Dactylellina haptotyla (strain CBS 200.50) TaxID=1284197 RepID=S8AFJ0_DACHA|nr:hypothetical protein H072_6277 [Dactylellina haptotyla CBS 200.50]
MHSFKVVALAVAVPLAYAQTQTLWGQCYGITYKGPIICPDSATCTTYNPYYGQCIPTSTPKPTTTKTTTPVVTTTSTCKTTTNCSATTLPVACGTALVTATYCQTLCAGAVPTRITVPAMELEKRCPPPITTKV